MRPNRYYCLLVCIAVLSGCHMFEDPEKLDTCPLNSGYPCPCSLEETEGECDDETQCYSENDDFGYCTMKCTHSDDCNDTRGFGVSRGVCENLAAGGEAAVKHCQVICELESDKGSCPPGMACVSEEGDRYAVCQPDV